MKRILMGAAVLALSSGWAAADSKMPPYTAEWGPRVGDWEATFGGTGASTDEFEENRFGLSGSAHYYFTKWLPVGLRQTFVTDFGGNVEDEWGGVTRISVDLQAPLGRFQPFIGVVGGYQYGETFEDDYVYGPEAGVKFWLNESTFIYGQGEYLIVGSDDFDEGNALYSFGFGLNF
jgi:opacity protein-like surface antigen